MGAESGGGVRSERGVRERGGGERLAVVLKAFVSHFIFSRSASNNNAPLMTTITTTPHTAWREERPQTPLSTPDEKYTCISRRKKDKQNARARVIRGSSHLRRRTPGFTIRLRLPGIIETRAAPPRPPRPFGSTFKHLQAVLQADLFVGRFSETFVMVRNKGSRGGGGGRGWGWKGR